METGKPEYNLIGTDQDPIPPSEPCFVLRGQDELASLAVRIYAEIAESQGLWAIARSAREAARRMQEWQPKKRPDL